MSAINCLDILAELENMLKPWVSVEQNINIKLTTNFINEYGIDSVGIMQMILAAEKKYNITINDSEIELELFTRAERLADLIRTKLNATQ